MKKSIIIALVLLGFQMAHAQAPEEQTEKIETAKIGFLTERMALSKEQAKEFWPLYDEFSVKKKEIKKAVKEIRDKRAEGKLSDAELLSGFRKIQQLKQKELDLENEYFERYIKILKLQQVGQLYRAEHDFNKMLMQKLKDNHH